MVEKSKSKSKAEEPTKKKVRCYLRLLLGCSHTSDKVFIYVGSFYAYTSYYSELQSAKVEESSSDDSSEEEVCISSNIVMLIKCLNHHL